MLNNETVILNPMATTISANSLIERFNTVGGNTGNLMFVESIKEQVTYSKEIGVHLPEATEEASKLSKSTTVVIPSSNFIIHGANSERFYRNFLDFIDKNDCPVTMIGLGAQANKAFNTPRKLIQKGLTSLQIEFFKRLAERAVSFGVRGEFTAECLEEMGIYNYRIIGCPSFYTYFDGVYPNIPAPTAKKAVMTFTPGTALQSRVFDLGISEGCTWVVQAANEIPRLINQSSHNIVSPRWKLRNLPFLMRSSKQILEYQETHSKVFFDLPSWDAFYKESDISFVFGTRFHGNMIALRNGVPALWISHDSRTDELTKFMHLPCIEIEKLRSIKSIDQLLEYCDYTETQKYYYELCENYVDFLNENKINHKFKLKRNGKDEKHNENARKPVGV